MSTWVSLSQLNPNDRRLQTVPASANHDHNHHHCLRAACGRVCVCVCRCVRSCVCVSLTFCHSSVWHSKYRFHISDSRSPKSSGSALQHGKTDRARACVRVCVRAFMCVCVCVSLWNKDLFSSSGVSFWLLISCLSTVIPVCSPVTAVARKHNHRDGHTNQRNAQVDTLFIGCGWMHAHEQTHGAAGNTHSDNEKSSER